MMSTNTLHIIGVGSTNPVKIAAVRAVLGQCWPHAQIKSGDVGSAVAEQPWGDEETRRGALNRARAVIAGVAEAGMGIGLEGGLIRSEFGVFTCAWCAVVDRQGRAGFGGSVNILLPDVVARRVLAGEELGPAMDALTGIPDSKKKMGAVGILTNGLIDRQTAYEQIVKLALGPFLSDHYRY